MAVHSRCMCGHAAGCMDNHPETGAEGEALIGDRSRRVHIPGGVSRLGGPDRGPAGSRTGLRGGRAQRVKVALGPSLVELSLLECDELAG